MMQRVRQSLCLCLLALLAACATQKGLRLEPVSYEGIEGWSEDSHAEALGAFIASCRAPRTTDNDLQEHLDTAAWRAACAKAPAYLSGGDATAQRFFEHYFEPYRMGYGELEEGLLTGYYAPVIEGALSPSAEYRWPVYGVPSDLVAGTPYFSRAEIAAGALRGKGAEIAWVKDPVMLFFMEIQGSGRLQLPDGRTVGLQYASKNNYSYTPIGRVLVERGELQKQEVSLQTIREWLYAYPEQAQEIMNQNESVVFFRRVDTDEMPKGAQGVPLTPERSLAADPSVVPYGLPIFIDTYIAEPSGFSADYQKLMVVQDTGGAIKGAMRGDIFFGAGTEAEHKAGLQKHAGRWIVLMPQPAGDDASLSAAN